MRMLVNLYQRTLNNKYQSNSLGFQNKAELVEAMAKITSATKADTEKTLTLLSKS